MICNCNKVTDVQVKECIASAVTRSRASAPPRAPAPAADPARASWLSSSRGTPRRPRCRSSRRPDLASARNCYGIEPRRGRASVRSARTMLRALVATLVGFCRSLTASRRRHVLVYAIVVTVLGLTWLHRRPVRRRSLLQACRRQRPRPRDAGLEPRRGSRLRRYLTIVPGRGGRAGRDRARPHGARGARFSSACAGAAFALLLRLTARHDKGASATFAFCSAVLLFPTITGMETALAVLSISALLWAASSEEYLGW